MLASDSLLLGPAVALATTGAWRYVWAVSMILLWCLLLISAFFFFPLFVPFVMLFLCSHLCFLTSCVHHGEPWGNQKWWSLALVNTEPAFVFWRLHNIWAPSIFPLHVCQDEVHILVPLCSAIIYLMPCSVASELWNLQHSFWSERSLFGALEFFPATQSPGAIWLQSSEQLPVQWNVPVPYMVDSP